MKYITKFILAFLIFFNAGCDCKHQPGEHEKIIIAKYGPDYCRSHIRVSPWEEVITEFRNNCADCQLWIARNMKSVNINRTEESK